MQVTYVENKYYIYITREEPAHGFVLDSRPIKSHVMLKPVLSTNQIFRQENPHALLLEDGSNALIRRSTDIINMYN